MKETDAILIFRQLLRDSSLNDLEEAVFRFSWQGLSYPQISTRLGYDHGYIRGVGFQLWRTLSEACGQRVTKKNIKTVFEYQARLLQQSSETALPPLSTPLHTSQYFDWYQRPTLRCLYGREAELEELWNWVATDKCRLVAVFGKGGIGKTAIATHATQQLQGNFHCGLWRSLHNSPTVDQLLADVIRFLSNRQCPGADLPSTAAERMALLLHYLKQQRCLLVLDNAETILQRGDPNGCYRPGYEDYGELLNQIAQQNHQSSVILISREKPPNLNPFEGEAATRWIQLTGLPPTASQISLEVNGAFLGSPNDWHRLVTLLHGNPLALQIAGAIIQEKFGGELAPLLDDAGFLFEDIHDLLAAQFQQLAPLEQQIMYWLAIAREPVTIETLETDMLENVPRRNIFDALKVLLRLSLIGKQADKFTEHPVVMEFVLQRLQQEIAREIAASEPNLLVSHALVQDRAPSQIKQVQKQVLLASVGQTLSTKFADPQELQKKFNHTLTVLRDQWFPTVGYGLDNLMNLARELGFKLGNNA